ncbi:MAG: hypothetical protein V1736_03605 [Pseudomonadota bacterium]
MIEKKKRIWSLGSTTVCIFCFLAGMPVVFASAPDRRGVTAGGSPALNSTPYYYNVCVQINGGERRYFTSIPACRGEAGYLFQYFPRDGETCSFQVQGFDSHGYPGPESVWSDPFVTGFVSNDCSATTIPIADPGEDQVVVVGTQARLNGSGSYDLCPADTGSLSYRWECYAAPETVILSDSHSVSPSFVPSKPGTYYFRLHVRDSASGSGFNRSAIRYVRVDAVENLSDIILANPGPPQAVPLGSRVILDGSRSAPSTAQYRWKNLNGSIPIENANQPVASFVPTSPGPFVFELAVLGQNDFSSKATLVSVYDPSVAGTLHRTPIEAGSLNGQKGDLDSDRWSDGADLAAFAAAYGSGRGLSAFRPDCDLDNDLRTDEIDLAIFAGCFGKDY